MENFKSKRELIDAFFHQADQFASTNKFTSLLLINKILKLDPENVKAHERLTSLLRDLKYLDQAAKAAEIGLKIFDANKETQLKIKGNLLMKKAFAKLENGQTSGISSDFNSAYNLLLANFGPSDEDVKLVQQTIKDLPNLVNQYKTKSDRAKKAEAEKVGELLKKLSIPEKANEPVYLISGEWLSNWKEYVSYDPNDKKEANEDIMEEEETVLPPGPISQASIIDDEISPLIDPKPEEAYTNYPIKIGLEEDKDYLMVDQRLWDYLQQIYGGGPEILRYTYFKSERDMAPSVEVWLQKINVVMYPILKVRTRTVKNFDVVYISRKKTVKDLKDKLYRIYKDFFPITDRKGAPITSRLWKIDPMCDFRAVLAEISQDKSNPLQGKVLSEDTLIEDAEIGDEDTVLFEHLIHPEWIFEDQAKTGSNKSIASRLRSEKNDIFRDLNISSTQEYKTSSRRGICGLQNLGNTCFMNSALQCMSNTYELTEYFLENRFIEDLNEKNPLGTGTQHSSFDFLILTLFTGRSGGRLAVAYAELLKEMWYGNQTYNSPWNFKKFHGYGQQDAQELLSYLLDGLHEDLNRIKDKPSVKAVESHGRPDDVVAKESWMNHLQRNSSRILELMHGQYKSRLDCPDCKQISITFDPFMILSLPIPTMEYSKFFIYYVPESPRTTPQKITLNVPNNTSYKEILEQIGSLAKADPETLTVGIIKEHKLVERANEKADAFYFKEHVGIPFVYEISELATRGEKSDSVLLGVFIYAEPKNFYEGEKLVSYTRLIPFNGQHTLRDVHLKVFAKMRRHISNHFNKSQKENPIDLSDSSFENIAKEYQAVFGESGEAEVPYNIYYNYDQSDGLSRKAAKSKKLPLDDVKLFEFVRKEGIDLDDFILELKITKATKIEYLGLNSCKEHESTSQHEGGPKNLTLQDCLNLFTRKERLDKDNAWYCNKCKEHKQATKKMEIWKTPDIFIAHLKRFKTSKVNSIGSYYYSSGSKKVGVTVEFPIKGLDLSKFVLSEDNGSCIYDLYAVANHYGSLGSGHYTAYAKNVFDGKWYEFNDSRVSPASEKDIVSAAAYVLFYRRRKD